MKKAFVFSSATFGKWKQKARALKRAGPLSHHEALEQVATANGFDNWHQVVNQAKLNELSEAACRSGLVVAYDIKDALDNWKEHESFVADERAFAFCDADLFAWYKRNEDEEENLAAGYRPADEAEYRNEYEEWTMNVYFFRYCGSIPATPRAVLPLLDERCFFAPMFFWHAGKFIEPFRDLAIDGTLDMSGNTKLNSAD
ncbi:hypothetical protein [Lacisediminimonas profundi]|uniref:hypothetical protein n=1 Tax=Lacisediminimonas profundi TaxID=2603856 RepID=UPI00124B5EBE|nr:hypothetical protein [Lacisediminimonas profundi]